MDLNYSRATAGIWIAQILNVTTHFKSTFPEEQKRSCDSPKKQHM